MRVCASPWCGDEASEKLGRAWYCDVHAAKRKAENGAARRAQARRVGGRDPYYEDRAQGLVKVARALDEAVQKSNLADRDRHKCEELWRRMIRALAVAEGIVD